MSKASKSFPVLDGMTLQDESGVWHEPPRELHKCASPAWIVCSEMGDGSLTVKVHDETLPIQFKVNYCPFCGYKALTPLKRRENEK